MSSKELIKTHLKHMCEHGEPGTLLPSVRELARSFSASPVTITRVIAALEAEGFVEARPGHGTFIKARVTPPAQRNFDWQTLVLGAPPDVPMTHLVGPTPPGCINFANGYMDDSALPERELGRAAARAVRKPNVWQRAPSGGLPELRAWFAERTLPGLEGDDVLLVHGGQAALGIAIRATVPRGSTLLVESPTYVGPLVIARAAGIQLGPVPVDEEGMRTDYLAEALERTRAPAIYLQPNFQNPTGVSLSLPRRKEIVELARRYNAFVIEDDYARDLDYHRAAPPPLFSHAEGHVIYVRSLTKSVAPSLRVAALCAHGPVLNRLRAALLVDDFFVPRPLQETALELVQHSSYAAHLRRLQATFAARMQKACALLRGALPQCSLSEPAGGYSLWLRLPDHLQEDDVCGQATRHGVTANPGHWWFAGEPVGQHLRLSIAGVKQDDLGAAVERLARAVHALDSSAERR